MINAIPQLKEVKLGKGEFVVNPQTTLLLGKAYTKADEFTAKLLKKEMESFIKTSLPLRVFSASLDLENTIILAISDRDKEFMEIFEPQDALADKRLKEEGYLIRVAKERILITARTGRGLFYGARTLRQLIKTKEEKIIIPSLWAKDWPDIRYRGIMQDISRGQVLTMNSFKELVRKLSYFKANMLSLYIEHTFTFEKHPLIGQGCGSLTKEEVKELDEYARDYHVELVPSFQALGHFRQILKHKEYAHLAETEARRSLSPAEEGSYQLLTELFSEIVPCFSSKFFNIGCDEVWDLGKGKSKPIAQRMGKGELYLSHILKVKKMLDEYGKTTMLWGDMLLHYPEIISRLPKDILIMNWHYGSRKLEGRDYYRPFLKAFQKEGLGQFACSGTSSWLRLFPDIKIAKKNISCFASEAYKYKVKGILNTNWGDDGNHNLLGYVWYGFAFSAEAGWNPEKIEECAFDKRFCSQFFGPHAEEIAPVFSLLSQSNYIVSIDLLEEYPSPFFLLFWDDPFHGKYSINVSDSQKTGRRLAAISRAALRILSGNKEKVKRNKKWLDDLFFAAQEIGYLGKRLLLVEEIKNNYQTSYVNLDNEKIVIECLKKTLALLKELKLDLLKLKEKYRTLWLRENREPGLDYNLKRYERVTQAWDNKIWELENIEREYKQRGGSLPTPDKLFPSKKSLT